MCNLKMSKGMFHTAYLAGGGVMAGVLLSAGLFHLLLGDAVPRWCVWPYASWLDSCCEAVPRERALFERL